MLKFEAKPLLTDRTERVLHLAISAWPAAKWLCDLGQVTYLSGPQFPHPFQFTETDLWASPPFSSLS